MTTELNHDMGTRLRVLREHLGKSPDEFAAIFGIKKRSYMAYERGDRSRGISLYKLYLLGFETDVSGHWLLTGCAGFNALRNDNRPSFYLSGRGEHARPPTLSLVAVGAS